MIGGRKLPPIEGDTNRWYMPGRQQDFHGRYSLSEAEFLGMQSLVPMIVQIRDGRFEVTCVNSSDERDLSMMLAAVRQTLYRDANRK
ncbi:hypothetical protein [Deinococcus sp. QL22]|uniref:hypothetical protein n=1 Tax=Deinococcus sp. QL22 TaxID=2939437 RepID=UPI0020172BCC|nr:hypothetical protein [Deinococcus sp. QL22]UQN10334.1 hypothetical protein M1R55_29730 [Deinococcus sp. QL22]UQN10468.1 hypothetical protein M1R55_29055 [Deinococcus sp. QL22]